jgi:hypothetical protein
VELGSLLFTQSSGSKSSSSHSSSRNMTYIGLGLVPFLVISLLALVFYELIYPRNSTNSKSLPLVIAISWLPTITFGTLILALFPYLILPFALFLLSFIFQIIFVLMLQRRIKKNQTLSWSTLFLSRLFLVFNLFIVIISFLLMKGYIKL